jgi:hypothetical protein
MAIDSNFTYAGQRSGEHQLVAAMILRAVEDLRVRIDPLFHHPTITRMTSDRRSAQRWLRSNYTGPFSFLWCCDIVGIDADSVRANAIANRRRG